MRESVELLRLSAPPSWMSRRKVFTPSGHQDTVLALKNTSLPHSSVPQCQTDKFTSSNSLIKSNIKADSQFRLYISQVQADFKVDRFPL